MTFIDNLVIGGGFAPTDPEIQDYLRRHAVAPTDAPDWIDADIVKPAELPGKQDLIEGPAEASTQKPSDSMTEWLQSLDEKSYEALQLYISGGKTDSQIVEQVYGYSNGTKVRQVKKIFDAYKEFKSTTTATTTPTTGQNLPNLGPMPA
jgi:hypothetical protein